MWLLAAPSVALATSELSLTYGADGMLTVVGDGWRPGQQLLVSLGNQSFSAHADSTGSFEVPTGLTSFQGTMAVHAPGALGRQPVRNDQLSAPNPLAVLFAQNLATGMTACVLAGALLGLLIPLVRRRSKAP
jgi:hypothetical protein